MLTHLGLAELTAKHFGAIDMKKLFIALSLAASFSANAGEFIIKDEIRGGIKQVILTSEESYGNGMIIIFVKEKVVQFQFQSMERVSGIHISNPKAMRWTPIVSNTFSIRFDSNLNKILSDSELLRTSVNVWPPCLKDACYEGTPKIMENVKGIRFADQQPDGRTKHSLGLTRTTDEFEGFYLLYKGSKRIAIEIDSKQYTFNIVSQ
jgi:hypothetical protein